MEHPNELDQQLENLRTLQQSYDQLASDLKAIKDAHILGFSIEGVVFSEGFVAKSPMDFVFNKNKIVEIHDNKCEEFRLMTAADYPDIAVIEFAEGTYIGGSGFMQNSSTIKSFSAPNSTPSSHEIFNFLAGCAELRLINLLHSDDCYAGNPPTVYNIGRNCPRLIDFIIGAGFTRNASSLAGWSPTIALENNDTSLLTDEDISAGFTSNLEKLLWNIRNHIAANLNPNITASIYFSAAVYAAISADQDTMDAFPASWTIASA